MTRRECDLKKPPNPLLCTFIQDHEPKLAQLQKEQRIAVDAFSYVFSFYQGPSQILDTTRGIGILYRTKHSAHGGVTRED